VAPGKTAPLFDPSFARDFEKWKQVWEPTGALAAETGRTEQGVRDFFYFKKRDPVTGAVSKSKSGYFMNDSEYARLHTEQRIGLIRGNPKELEQWANVFIYDIYGMVIELQRDDPKNLYERLTQIKVPIFLAFGDKEPFIPGTSLNGLNNLANDVINPFMSRMIEAGNRPVLKIYPETGHFIHTDNPVEFSADIVDFITLGNVEQSPLAVDRLVNGATTVGTAVAPTPPGPSPTSLSCTPTKKGRRTRPSGSSTSPRCRRAPTTSPRPPRVATATASRRPSARSTTPVSTATPTSATEPRLSVA